MTMNEEKRSSTSLIVFVVLLLVIVILVISAFKLFSFSDKESAVSGEDNEETTTDNSQENFVGDYFTEEFAKSPEANEVESEGIGESKSCELLGQNVREGTVINDSTCASP